MGSSVLRHLWSLEEASTQAVVTKDAFRSEQLDLSAAKACLLEGDRVEATCLVHGRVRLYAKSAKTIGRLPYAEKESLVRGEGNHLQIWVRVNREFRWRSLLHWFFEVVLNDPEILSKMCPHLFMFSVGVKLTKLVF